MLAAVTTFCGSIRISSGPFRITLKPRCAFSSCRDDTPRSRSAPPIVATPSWSRTLSAKTRRDRRTGPIDRLHVGSPPDLDPKPAHWRRFARLLRCGRRRRRLHRQRARPAAARAIPLLRPRALAGDRSHPPFPAPPLRERADRSRTRPVAQTTKHSYCPSATLPTIRLRSQHAGKWAFPPHAHASNAANSKFQNVRARRQARPPLSAQPSCKALRAKRDALAGPLLHVVSENEVGAKTRGDLAPIHSDRIQPPRSCGQTPPVP